MQKYTFPDFYQEKIEALLQTHNYSLNNPRQLAQAILKLSSHYQSATRITPWEKPEFVAAYAAYFFPLNYVRNLKIWAETKALQFPHHFSKVIDFGCGLGSALLAAQDSAAWPVDTTPIYAIDHYHEPLQLLKKHFLNTPSLSTEMPVVTENTLGIFSYSWNELKSLPSWFWNLDHIYIVEPSTAPLSRKLMDFRQQLMDKNYYIWGPCTHSESCPLLSHSKTDWCHDRVHWEQPEWFRNIESHLPIKNQTLTMSYLIASKVKPPTTYFGRIVGDELLEKGKTRWMFCRNQNREFLSHLSRNGSAPDWKRGHLFKTEIEHESKANELRLCKK